MIPGGKCDTERRERRQKETCNWIRERRDKLLEKRRERRKRETIREGGSY
jgi:hypothetical protein